MDPRPGVCEAAGSNILLRNEGHYWPCVFGGWYATDEIAGRDLAPPQRFDVLPQVAEALGLPSGHRNVA
jgi:nitric oxide synthase oxygenase domain/subunit